MLEEIMKLLNLGKRATEDTNPRVTKSKQVNHGLFIVLALKLINIFRENTQLEKKDIEINIKMDKIS